MTPKIVLTTTGIIMLLHGILFFFGADEMARSGVPDIGEKVLRVSIALAEIVAIISVFHWNGLNFQQRHRNFFSKKSANWNRNWLSFSYSWSY